jgi:hypothetical protein
MSFRQKIYNYLFNHNVGPNFLPLFRIGLALILIANALNLKSEYIYFFKSDGIINQDIKNIEISNHCFTVYDVYTFVHKYINIAEVEFIKILGYVYMIFLVAFLIGFFTKISTWVIYIIHLLFLKSLVFMVYGMDFMHNILLFYALFMPLGIKLSVDNLLFKFKDVSSTRLSFYSRILQIHLCIIYFFGGLGKALGFNWWNGHSIWKSLNRPDANLELINYFAYVPFLLVIIGIKVILLELFYPFLINYKKTRTICFIFIMIMHIFIGYFIQLSFFSATMILFNFIAFYNLQKNTTTWDIVNS